MNFIRALVLAALAAATIAAHADVVNITSVKDNTLHEDADGLLSNGIGPVMFVGEVASGGTSGSRRGVIEFDIAGNVPAGSTINSVTLRMYCSRTTSGSRRIELHRLLQEWGEGTSQTGDETTGGGGGGGGATTGDATWLHRYYNDVFWTTTGGDFSAVNSGDTMVNQIGHYNWSAAGMRADVQGWLDDPESNHGWLMLGMENGSRTAKRFNTHEAVTPGTQPQLTIDFTPPPSPCPGDVDGDDDVDMDDLTLLLSAFGRCESEPGYNDAADFVNNDCIDINDLALLLSGYGMPCP